MNFTENVARQPRALIVAEMAVALLTIAAFDFVTDYKIPLASFYSVPVFVLAWFCGKKWGNCCCGFREPYLVTKPLNLTTAKSGWHLANYDERASLAPFKVLTKVSKAIDR
jgi:hypothetical protein